VPDELERPRVVAHHRGELRGLGELDGGVQVDEGAVDEGGDGVGGEALALLEALGCGDLHGSPFAREATIPRARLGVYGLCAAGVKATRRR
jgi:hypothetical protein